MDPKFEDEDDEAAAMAAAMGFSAFGSQKPPAKKRKFNPTTDAFVDGQELASLDKGGKKGQGSGGNTIPLGKARVFGTNTKAEVEVVGNDEEIDLGEDEELEGPQYVDTSLPPPIERTDEGRAQYVDTSEQPPAVSSEEAKEMQERIDAILAAVESGDHPPTDTEQPHGLPRRPPLPPPTTFNDTNLIQGLLKDGFVGSSRETFSDTTSMASSRPSHRSKGQRNENWYLDYYDPSFNENPWKHLEKEKGLEPLGVWPQVQGRKFP